MLTSGLHGGKRTDWHFHDQHWSRTWYADWVQHITLEGVGQIKIRDQGELFVGISDGVAQESEGLAKIRFRPPQVFTRTVKVTICILLERVLDRP